MQDDFEEDFDFPADEGQPEQVADTGATGLEAEGAEQSTETAGPKKRMCKVRDFRKARKLSSGFQWLFCSCGFPFPPLEIPDVESCSLVTLNLPNMHAVYMVECKHKQMRCGNGIQLFVNYTIMQYAVPNMARRSQ